MADLSNKECSELKELFAEASKHLETLNDWEKQFIADVGSRFARFANKLYLSEKQWDTIEKIQKKVFDR